MTDAPDGGRPTRVVLASLEAWDDVWRRNQYLVDGLLRANPGLEVLFVEPAADPLHALSSGRRGAGGRGLRVAPAYGGRLHLYQPTKLLPRRVGPIADRLLLDGTRRVVSRLGWPRGVLWINDPGSAALLDVLGWPCLYDITDDWVAADRGSREHDRIAAGDADLLRRSEEVVVCSTGLGRIKGTERMKRRDRTADPEHDVHLIANAVDVERYRRQQPRPADFPDRSVALYVGTLHEDRLDVDLVLRTADEVEGIVMLLGPDALEAGNRSRLAAHPQILIAGARSHEQVPAYLQHANVLIVPHVVDEFTESLDPIKLYEYRAVGRPVVSSPVAGFRDAPGVRVASRKAFPLEVADLMRSWTPSVEAIDVPDWSQRVAAFSKVLGQIGP